MGLRMDIVCSGGKESSNMKELKPCPFCGSENIRIMGNSNFWCMCDQCGVETQTYDTEEELIEAWNARVEENDA